MSLKTETLLEMFFGSALRAGSKTFFAQELWQTTEQSMGVMLMLRKPCW